MPEHSVLTGAQLHEPKGVASAGADRIYVADGLGSGSHKKVYTQGWEDYNDLATASAPIALAVAGTFYDLTNDGAGTFTNTAYRLPGHSAIWDVSTNRFDWSGAGLVLGDTVDIRIDIDIVNSGANGEFTLNLDLAIGSGSDYSLPVATIPIKSAGTVNVTRFYSVYMGDANTLNNPAKFSISSDSTGDTVIVNGWYVRTIPFNPILA